VDDTPAVLNLIAVVLEYQGFTVLTADNGQDALITFTSQPVDAVVLDYDMPGMNGVQVALRMKQLKPHVPILLFTAEPAVLRGQEAVDVVLGKGEGVKAVAAILRRAINPRGMPPLATRRSRRYPVGMPFMILADRFGLQMYQGIATDIGEGGIGGRVEEGALVPSEFVLLQKPDSRLETPLEPRAQVRYCHGENCGFAFLDVTQQQRSQLRTLLP
jgi:CheY-like chemotaxis protein